MRPIHLLLALGACAHAGAPERVRLPDLRARFRSPEWALLTSPIEPPTSRDGRDRIRVWLRAPEGARIDARRDGNRWVLQYPPGVSAERVESRDEVPLDARGTDFDARGEVFHALRGDGRGGLEGFAWRRGDIEARNHAILALAKDIRAHDPGVDVHFYCRTGDCAGCHVHDKRANDGTSRPPLPTDDGGLYRVETVLEDDAPLVESRARDPNLESPFVTVSCASGPPTIAHATAHCPSGAPTAHFDMRRALRAGDPHARAVCASRAFLREHMTDRARAAFATAFSECAP